MAKIFHDQPLPGFNFKSYLLLKYDGFFPRDLPTAKELREERRTIMQMYRHGDKMRALAKYKSKVARYNKVMSEWARFQQR